MSPQCNFKIRWRTQTPGFFRPFDNANRGAVKAFFEARIVPFLRTVESIKIKVIHTIPRNYVKFNQCVGGALYGAAMAQCAQQSASEGGFAAPEFAYEVNHQSGAQDLGKRSAERERGGLVWQNQLRMMGR